MGIRRLVTELVDLGALQSGAFRLHPAPVRLRLLIESCLEEATPLAESRKLKIEYGIGPGVPSFIQSDEARLRQLLLILLEHSLETSVPGNVIILCRRSAPGSEPRADSLTRGAKFAGAWLDILVSHSGPILSREEQSRILASSQSESPVEKSDNSASLSLILAAKLCQALSGQLLVESDHKDCETFIVRLPLGLPADPELAAEAELSPIMPSGA